jgi:hypothetical protein
MHYYRDRSWDVSLISSIIDFETNRKDGELLCAWRIG